MRYDIVTIPDNEKRCFTDRAQEAPWPADALVEDTNSGLFAVDVGVPRALTKRPAVKRSDEHRQFMVVKDPSTVKPGALSNLVLYQAISWGGLILAGGAGFLYVKKSVANRRRQDHMAADNNEIVQDELTVVYLQNMDTLTTTRQNRTTRESDSRY
ncbi:hypothetical protein BV22DRAFT_1047004 [Leucogyrophana mollusca]|uniref:Uncharacterized protein n=1 Tax=Leucogyrophana mollusca TaxID=85980 RepID=A0ACB8BH19_9AGAM|nr:hypothetical protein BV22DRAFT_1047004 [Leucogyrophana mollusca]